MKTKIIYISGSEVFDMADIRAAFDEVRSALDLKDTVLFGVPVDREDALAVPSDSVTTISDIAPVAATPQAASEIAEAPTINVEAEEEIVDISPVAEVVEDVAPVEEAIPEVDEEIEEIEPAPKKSRGRPRKVVPVEEIEESAEEITTTAPDAMEHKVIPILSVLAAKEVAAPIQEEVPTVADEIEEVVIEEDLAEEIVEDIPVAAAQDITAEEVSIEDMIDDDIPDNDTEKTLEQLLESMKPLREDHIEQSMTPAIATDSEDSLQINDDADATLAQLATEFVENQDQIVARPQNESHGKIGKLKNILPFKKVKRDDNGLMGDLFGWAGIAANDEDFAIPGFFTTAAKK